MITQENRLDPRVRVQVRVELSDPTQARQRVLHTTNLSVGGARCTGTALLRIGETHEVRLFLPVSEFGRDREVVLKLQARVVHALAFVDASGDHLNCDYGFAFDSIDEASRDELRDFLYDAMASDSAWHGPAGEDPR